MGGQPGRRGKQRKTVFACIVGSSLLFAACSGSKPAASHTQSSTTTPASGSSGVSQAQQLVASSQRPSTWTAPGPKIDVTSLAGKSVYLITNGANQFTETVGAGLVSAGKKANVTVVPDYTTGGLASADQGFATAIAQHMSAIVVMSFLSSALSAPIQQAVKAGIPVIEIGEHDPGPLSAPEQAAGVFQDVSPSYSDAGSLMADYVIADSGGHADVLLLNSPDVGDANVETAAFQAQLAKLCPACKVKVDGIPQIDRTSQLPPAVTSAISADPNLNYIVPVFDTMYPYFSSALTASAGASRISLVGFDASGAEMTLLQKHAQGWVADGGYDDTWLGWASMDEAFRAMLHQPATENEDIPLRFFTAATTQGMNFAPGSPVDPWFGNPAYQSGFMALWSLHS